MQGRYGRDRLNKALDIVMYVGLLSSIIIHLAVRSAAGKTISTVLLVIGLAAWGFSLFRTFSRNIAARQAENNWYCLKIASPFSKKRNELKSRAKGAATHRFFKCPKCHQTVRVPKGKGKIKIKCPKCGETFIKKT